MVKKLLAFGIIAFSQNLASAQEVVFYDFEDGQIPANFSLHNEDGLTPAQNVAMFTDAWILQESASLNGNRVMSATSWHNPAGQSDDWMVIQDIELPSSVTGSLVLQWKARALDPSFPDGYQVKLSTTTSALESFTVDLFETAAEEASSDQLFPRSVDLTEYAGQTIHIAFRNNSNDKYILQIDEIGISDVLNTPDVAITESSYYPFSALNDSIALNLSLLNKSGLAVDSVNVTYIYGPSSVTVQYPLAHTIAPLGESNLTLQLPVEFEGEAEYGIAVSVNGESNFNDNILSAYIFGVDNPPARKPFIEEGTGAWCGFCPRGHVAMELLENEHGENVTLAAVHVNDVMEDQVYAAGFNTIVSGYPSGVIDRSGEIFDPSDFISSYQTFSQFVSPVSLAGNASLTGPNELTVTLDATFAVDYGREGINFNVVLTEDGVSGTTSDYNQVNYYSGGQFGPLSGAGHDWAAQSDPVPAAEMVYDHVARAIAGGFEGEAPTQTSFEKGETYTHTFVIDLNAAKVQNPANLHVVLLAQEAESGRFYNSEYAQYATGINEYSTERLRVHPNPAKDFVVFDVTQVSDLKILDLNGRVVTETKVSPGKKVDVSALEAGVYTAVITKNAKSHTAKVIVQ